MRQVSFYNRSNSEDTNSRTRNTAAGNCKQQKSTNVSTFSILIGQINYRVTTAQGKRGIWLLTFSDRENVGNLVNLFFYTEKIVAAQGKFYRFFLKMFLFKWQQGDGAFLC